MKVAKNVIWNRRINFKKILYAFAFLIVSFIFMRYYGYLGNDKSFGLGMKLLENLNSRGFLTFVIYLIFSMILYSATCDMFIKQRIIIVILTTFLIAFLDATIDYSTGFGFPVVGLLINTSGAILSLVLIGTFHIFMKKVGLI